MRSTRGDKIGIALGLDAGLQRHTRHENESTRDGRWHLDENEGYESCGFHTLHFYAFGRRGAFFDTELNIAP